MKLNGATLVVGGAGALALGFAFSRLAGGGQRRESGGGGGAFMMPSAPQPVVTIVQGARSVPQAAAPQVPSVIYSIELPGVDLPDVEVPDVSDAFGDIPDKLGEVTEAVGGMAESLRDLPGNLEESIENALDFDFSLASLLPDLPDMPDLPSADKAGRAVVPITVALGEGVKDFGQGLLKGLWDEVGPVPWDLTTWGGWWDALKPQPLLQSHEERGTEPLPLLPTPLGLLLKGWDFIMHGGG